MLKTAFILFLFLASGCKDQYTPKPYGYFRIDFPEKQWVASPDTPPWFCLLIGIGFQDGLCRLLETIG